MVQETEITIRPAEVADAPGIAQVHIASWREAYAGIVPADYLASLDPASRVQTWEDDLRNGARDGVRTWVAHDGARVLGFASVGPARDEDASPRDAEIYSIYLDPKMWGKGVARDLIRTVLSEVPRQGSLTLWTLAGNERALRFYRRHGFTPDGAEKLEEFGGAQLLEVRYRRG
jgi:ribosomal protein S18 acetylase RimI-like enzyme